MTKRVYLAGPEVFLANARDIGVRKRTICERRGLVGVFPGCDPALPPAERVSPSAAPWNASCGGATP